ncbi:MAG: hypothetical protein Q9184_001132 [Pyrenodesmia sp. 2 TL-2023]
MRNAVQRRNHKERAQPAQREKWGSLEKHKDYSLRAKDYNEKKKRLKGLREKAAERNPDEFSYSMLNSKTDRHGRNIKDRGNATLSHDAVKLLKTQDAGYLKTVIQQTRRSRERVEQSFQLSNGEGVLVPGRGDGGTSGQHVIFAGSPEEQQLLGSTQRRKDSLSSAEDGLQKAGPEYKDEGGQQYRDLTGTDPRRATRAKEEIMRLLRQERAARKLRKRQREGYESRLTALKTREKDLLAAEQQLGHGRARMSSSVGGVNKAGVKWKIRERKR